LKVSDNINTPFTDNPAIHCFVCVKKSDRYMPHHTEDKVMMQADFHRQPIGSAYYYHRSRTFVPE
jgi:hypothetical protein